MNFEHFDELCRGSWPSWGSERELARASHPAERHFGDVLQRVPGMATENKLALLNHAVSCLEENEVYVEIGCWRGTSLVGAMLNNTEKHAFACDNFSEFGGPRDEFHKNLAEHHLDARVKFYDEHYETFLNDAPWAPRPVGVYFYDGGHSFSEQYIALEKIIPHLAERALVLVDDTNALRVRRANRIFCRRHPALSIYRSLRTPTNGHPTWWNGIEVFRFEKQNRDRVAPRPRWFEAESLAWDRVEPVVDMAHQKIREQAARVPGARKLWHALRPN